MKHTKQVLAFGLCVILVSLVLQVAVVGVVLSNDETLTNATDGTVATSGDFQIVGHDLDLYDAAGWTGIKFNTPEIEFWIGGTKVRTFATDGSATDEV